MARKKKHYLLASHHVPRELDKEVIADLMRIWEGPLGAEKIEAIDAQKAKVLAHAGLQLEPGRVFATDDSGNFYEFFAGTSYRRVRVSGLHNLAERKGHVIGSDVWYAARIREKIADWRQAPDQTYKIETLLALGILLGEARIIPTNGRALENGLQTLPKFQEGRDALNKQRRLKKEAWLKEAIEEGLKILSESPKLSNSEVARRVVKRRGLGERKVTPLRKAIGKARKG